ncbi:MAG: efflux transporter outer membrane subunit [Planctomycetaceae bacterium]|nr:efflux transporter outer membrane subunit [Planctomycetaceae bacterium]
MDGARPLAGDRFPMLHRLCCCLIVLTVAGCATTGARPAFSPHSLPDFSQSGSAIVPDRWWQEFEDPALNLQVERALGGNFDLAAAVQRLRAARAVTRREASDLFPDLNGFADLGHTFRPQTNRTRSNWGLNASYQVDLWGRIQSRIDAERLRADATQNDYQTIALTVAAEVARTWYALVESRAQRRLLDDQLATNQEGLEVVRQRFAKGQGGSPDVLRQEQLVESTREQITVVEADIEVLEHQLAILTGQPPQDAQYRTGTRFPGLPEAPFVGLPSDLLSRRPDVRADYLAFAASDRDVEVAVTDQYPRLDLTASLINSAENPEAVFRDWFLSIGGQLIGPLLDGGQRRAEVERTKAVRCQRFSEYRQTVLIALQEVEDGLALEYWQQQRIARLEDQQRLAADASSQLAQRYITGEASYLDILSANQSEQRLQRSLLAARLDQILIRIGLYLALAGDFDTRPEIPLELPEDLPVIPVRGDSTRPGEAAKPLEALPEPRAPQVETVPLQLQSAFGEISLIRPVKFQEDDCRSAIRLCNDEIPADPSFLTETDWPHE